jgi:hypothetical protein
MHHHPTGKCVERVCAGFQYIPEARRTLTAFRSARGRIHIASDNSGHTDPSPVVPPLTASEARGLAKRLEFLADELDELSN